MSDKSRVLLVSRPAAGGMRVHLRRLVEGLADEYEFVLAAPKGLPEEVGVRGDTLDVPDRLSPFRLPGLVLRLARIIRRERPQVVHAHGYVAGTIAAMASPVAGVSALLCTLHNLFPPNASSAGRRALQICGRSCYRLIAITEAVKASAISAGVSPEKLVIIPNGIEIAPFDRPVDRNAVRAKLEIPPDAPVLLAAARLIPAKGIDVLLQATRSLRETWPGIRVLIAGDGPQREELESLSKELDLEQTVSFLGERDDLPELLKASDLVAVPSLMEGQSLFVLEAMAARVPVVAANVGGMAEMIHDGKTGLLVPPGDPTALAQASALLLRDSALGRHLVEEARRFVESEMTLEKMLQRTRDLYRTLVRK